MMKQVRNIILTAILAVVMTGVVKAAAPVVQAAAAKVPEFTITPKVSFDVGYVTRANHLGLQIQKNSAFVSSSVSLENSVVTPTISSTYFMAGENKSQIMLDASLTKGLTLGPITAVSVVGIQKRFIDGGFEDSFTAYGGLRLVKVPLLSAIATPYVSVARDFNYDLLGTTLGMDRTFTLGSVSLTPRAEAYLFDKHTAYTAGGNLAYNGFKYVKPYVDVAYVTSDTALAARKFEGNLAATVGVKMSF